MVKASPKKLEYIAAYDKEAYDKVLIRFPRGTRERILATGMSLNGFTVQAVLDKLKEVEQGTTPSPDRE